ncbi:hypothetical protein, conserved [Eimeria tenella]|uniref:Uncharacterized protein n=1 Tax=Eimeria tenella TaxID=5802 RepID=U6L571_EIMTE|nr:hypothetical protein, conserved [Eimeria tenella]CDJ45532.1 hypothetical protein, conserved [Eimeria tenella]|eukprot:XP_013236278.1 hypothetical protein, conserved [Eimeria tenella]
MEAAAAAAAAAGPPSAAAKNPKEANPDEELACRRLAIPAHLGLSRGGVSSEFDSPQEGLAIYAAFSEAVLAFAAAGKIDAQQMGCLHRLFKTTLEEELGQCVRGIYLFGNEINKRKRKRGGAPWGAPLWQLRGALVGYQKEGKKFKINVSRASLLTTGLVLQSEALRVSILDPS